MDNRVLLSRQFTVVKWGAGTQFCKFTKLQKYRNSLSLSKILQSHPNDKKETKIVKLYQQVFLKGAMDKKARGDICAHFLCFLTDFSEIFSISFF